MAETTDIKKFLDHVGVSKLWTNITNTFAPKWLAYRPNKTLERSETDIKIKYESAGKSNGLGEDILITLPVANTSEAGLLSAGDKGKIDSLGSSLSEVSKYKSNITDLTLKMPNAVGGIAKNTTVGDLNDKTYNEMFDALLFPSVKPSYTSPSIGGFALSNSTSPVIIGSNVATISAATFNKGEWTQYNTTNKVNLSYAGNATSTNYSITINGTTYTSISGLPSKYTKAGNQTYSVTISYSKGPSPKDNKGVEHAEWACPAGSTGPLTRTINVTYPIYATTQAINTFTQTGLKSWSSAAITSSEVELIDQAQGPASETTKQAFLVPYPSGRNTTVIIEWYNPQSGKWENHTSQFAKADTTKSINGISVNYRYYYFNSTAGIGKRKFRITF